MPPSNFFLRALGQFMLQHENMFTLFTGVAIGGLSGLGAYGFRHLIEFFTHLFQMIPRWSEATLGVAWPGVVLMPALGGLIIGPIIYRYAREARGHGVPEVMVAVMVKGGFIRRRVVAVKALASAICIGSGGSVGREGPIIQIGSSIGSSLGYFLRVNPRLMRTFVACGAAGGIAATFNAPIAGALFAVEIILGDFGFIQLAPIITSSVIATVVSHSLEGDYAAFHVPGYTLTSPLELVMYLVLGLVCGVASVTFIRTLDRMETIFERYIPVHQSIMPVVGGLMVGAVGVFFPQIFGVGYDTIDEALYGRLPFFMLLMLAGVKLMSTTITLASGGSGGVFAPSLFMGSMLGGVTGTVANWISPTLTSSPGAYSLVGMAAMVGAATHAPITAIVMIFELTNDYKIILPLMISTIIGVLTASTLYRDSIYTHKLRKKGIELEQGMEVNLLKRVTVQDIMNPEPEIAPEDLPFNFLLDQLMQTARSRVAVVNQQGQLLGSIPREVGPRFLSERGLLSELVISRDVMRPDCPVVLPKDPLDHALLVFQEHACREVYVVNNHEERKVVGMVTKGDLVDAYQNELMKRSAGDTFAYNINRPHRLETVKVMDGYGIMEVEAPHHFANKRLLELNMRQVFGVTVLAIKRPIQAEDGSPSKKVWVPESSDTIMDGDVLVLLGEIEKINNFQKT